MTRVKNHKRCCKEPLYSNKGSNVIVASLSAFSALYRSLLLPAMDLNETAYMLSDLPHPFLIVRKFKN